MDIRRALVRFWALLRGSVGLAGKIQAIRAIYLYTLLRFGLWASPKPIELNVDHHRFEVDLGRKELASVLEVLLERCYEPDPAWVTRPGDTVLDIGANVGVFSVLQGTRVKNGRVYAFEPSPTTYTRLRRNVALNHLQNVETFPEALGDRQGRVRFVDKPISLNSYVLQRETGEPTVEVEVKTLDDFVQARGIRRIDLMKIDTEGHELPVLAGAVRSLEKTQRVVLETHRPEDEAPVRKVLESAGFSLSHRERELFFFTRKEGSSEMAALQSPSLPGA
jgi:FkbM family methyltransferase